MLRDQGASCTQRKVSNVPFVFSIPFVLNWGGSISPDSFLSSILLVVVMVVIVVVMVILVVVVVAIIGVVIVVTIIRIVVVVIVGGVPSIIKLSFVIVGSCTEHHAYAPDSSSLGLMLMACNSKFEALMQ
ncbi:hypothetical protein Tco_0347363 [Tanacetum coccineum]